jgi:hypothetical protein
MDPSAVTGLEVLQHTASYGPARPPPDAGTAHSRRRSSAEGLNKCNCRNCLRLTPPSAVIAKSKRVPNIRHGVLARKRRQPKQTRAHFALLVRAGSRPTIPDCTCVCASGPPYSLERVEPLRPWLPLTAQYLANPGLWPGVTRPQMLSCVTDVAVAPCGTCRHVRLSRPSLPRLRSRRCSRDLAATLWSNLRFKILQGPKAPMQGSNRCATTGGRSIIHPDRLYQTLRPSPTNQTVYDPCNN